MKPCWLWLAAVLAAGLCGGCPDGTTTATTTTFDINGEWRMIITAGEYPGADSCFTVEGERVISWRNACNTDIPVSEGQAVQRSGSTLILVFKGPVYTEDDVEEIALGTLRLTPAGGEQLTGSYTVTDLAETVEYSYSAVRVERP